MYVLLCGENGYRAELAAAAGNISKLPTTGSTPAYDVRAVNADEPDVDVVEGDQRQSKLRLQRVLIQVRTQGPQPQ
jgi:hypothetical protein